MRSTIFGSGLSRLFAEVYTIRFHLVRSPHGYIHMHIDFDEILCRMVCVVIPTNLFVAAPVCVALDRLFDIRNFDADLKTRNREAEQTVPTECG